MISVSSLIEELRTLASHPLIQRTDILDKTRAILKARICFGPDLFLQIYRNDQSRTTSFALVCASRRVFGIDEISGQWHIHPARNPVRHRPLLTPPATLREVFRQVEEVLAGREWLL
jgi:hypothetical protein